MPPEINNAAQQAPIIPHLPPQPSQQGPPASIQGPNHPPPTNPTTA